MMSSIKIAKLPVFGMCRFSYLGFSDWRIGHRGREGRTADQIIAETRKTLFDPTRLEQRFATFEALTLPSLAAQTDKDFTFLVLASDELPEVFRQRLIGLALRYPFMQLVFGSVGYARHKFDEALSERGVSLKDILQFRLDDDDAVGKNYIRRMRKIAQGFHAIEPKRGFAISFPAVLMVGNVNGKLVMRHRHFSQHVGWAGDVPSVA